MRVLSFLLICFVLFAGLLQTPFLSQDWPKEQEEIDSQYESQYLETLTEIDSQLEPDFVIPKVLQDIIKSFNNSFSSDNETESLQNFRETLDIFISVLNDQKKQDLMKVNKFFSQSSIYKCFSLPLRWIERSKICPKMKTYFEKDLWLGVLISNSLIAPKKTGVWIQRILYPIEQNLSDIFLWKRFIQKRSQIIKFFRANSQSKWDVFFQWQITFEEIVKKTLFQERKNFSNYLKTFFKNTKQKKGDFCKMFMRPLGKIFPFFLSCPHLTTVIYITNLHKVLIRYHDTLSLFEQYSLALQRDLLHTQNKNIDSKFRNLFKIQEKQFWTWLSNPFGKLIVSKGYPPIARIYIEIKPSFL